MAKTTITLQRFSSSLANVDIPNEAALTALHGRQITVTEIPRPGDFIKDSETRTGYVEVAKIIFDLKGNITVAIK